MAEWKKVIVSGSSAHLSELKVGSNQLITNSQATTSLTGSFTGSFSGSGAGLTGVTATASFPTTNKSDLVSTDKFFINDDAGDATSGNKKITYGSLLSDLAGTNLTVETTDSLTLATTITGLASVTSTTFVGALTGNASTVTTNANLTGNVTSAGNVTTIANGVVTSAMIANDTITNEDISSTAAIAYSKLNLAGSTIHSGSFFNGITVVSSSAQVLNGSGVFSGSAQLPSGIISGSAQLPSGIISGSAQLPLGTVSGSSQVLAGTTIHSGSFFNGIAVVSSSAQVLNGTGIISSSVLSSTTQGQVTLTSNGTTPGAVSITGLTTSASPQFQAATITTDLAVNGGDITTNATTATVFNNGATTVNAFGSAIVVGIGAATGTTTVNNNLSVKGTLYVEGSVTAISSSNLYVADQFILLASGSPNNTDGGIIIDRGAYAGLNIAYGFDSTTGRWGYQAGVADTETAIDPTGISGSFAGYVFTEASHGATKPITGEFAKIGSSYMDATGNFWIYTA